ncbi:MAG: ferritin family protein, partial [Nitrospiraceae bacterium]|nr:ferritin family protein [Nitrospiraceae bacterium]
MDIYDYAMQMEKDGENYYNELRNKTTNQGLKAILGMLIAAEVKHYALFQNMKQRAKVQVPDSPILADVKNIFVQMRERKDFNVDVTQKELYRKAQDIEVKSRDFYRAKADEVTDASQKEAFRKIAQEEQRHFIILE